VIEGPAARSEAVVGAAGSRFGVDLAAANSSLIERLESAALLRREGSRLVPTLDGLGPIGGNDHSPDEYLEIDSIVPRTVLFAALLIAVARDPVIASWRPHPA